MKKCQCACCDCKLAAAVSVTEYDLHAFVGANAGNRSVDLEEFEHGLDFESVTHWDVGFTEQARYYIYHDQRGRCIAWYDNAYECGYSPKRHAVLAETI